MTSSPPFKVEKGENKITLRGYGAKQRKAFFQLFADEAKDGGIYSLKPVEVTASSLQRNYLFAIYGVLVKDTGYGFDAIRAFFENIMLESALDIENDFYSREIWVIDVCDLETGELKKQVLKTLTSWDVSMMSQFIDLVVFVSENKFPKSKIPNPKDYTFERVGRKNEVPYPNEFSEFTI